MPYQKGVAPLASAPGDKRTLCFNGFLPFRHFLHIVPDSSRMPFPAVSGRLSSMCRLSVSDCSPYGTFIRSSLVSLFKSHLVYDVRQNMSTHVLCARFVRSTHPLLHA